MYPAIFRSIIGIGNEIGFQLDAVGDNFVYAALPKLGEALNARTGNCVKHFNMACVECLEYFDLHVQAAGQYIVVQSGYV